MMPPPAMSAHRRSCHSRLAAVVSVFIALAIVVVLVPSSHHHGVLYGDGSVKHMVPPLKSIGDAQHAGGGEGGGGGSGPPSELAVVALISTSPRGDAFKIATSVDGLGVLRLSILRHWSKEGNRTTIYKTEADVPSITPPTSDESEGESDASGSEPGRRWRNGTATTTPRTHRRLNRDAKRSHSAAHSTTTPPPAPLVTDDATLEQILAPPPQFIALVTHDVPAAFHDAIRLMGWDIQIAFPPLRVREIMNARIRKEMPTDGALGINELVKLEALRMGDRFARVLVMDTDMVVLKSLRPLFRVSLRHPRGPDDLVLGFTPGGWPTEPLNGGLLLFNPRAPTAREHFDAIIAIVREGDFRVATGWRGSGIGWTYGGRTIQGVLPYYFFHVLEHRFDYRLDRCRYNNMAQGTRCLATPLDKITIAHMTGDCPKPWWCDASPSSPLCFALHRQWWAVARDLRDFAADRVATDPGLRPWHRQEEHRRSPKDTVTAEEGSGGTRTPLSSEGLGRAEPLERVRRSSSGDASTGSNISELVRTTLRCEGKKHYHSLTHTLLHHSG